MITNNKNDKATHPDKPGNEKERTKNHLEPTGTDHEKLNPKSPPNMTVHARKESGFITANGNSIPKTVSPPNIGNKRQKTIGNNPYPNPSTPGSEEKMRVFANPKYYQALIIQYKKSTGKSARTCNPPRDNSDNHSTASASNLTDKGDLSHTYGAQPYCTEAPRNNLTPEPSLPLLEDHATANGTADNPFVLPSPPESTENDNINTNEHVRNEETADT